MHINLQKKEKTTPVLDGLIHSEVSISEIPMWQLPGKGKVRPDTLSKVVTRIMERDGLPRKVEIEIMPSAKWGYPTVLDLEYFRAFERALTMMWEREGVVPDVLRISGRELIRLTGRTPNGDRQQEVREFLDRLSGLVLQEHRKNAKGRRAETGVHIFERIDREEMSPGDRSEGQWTHQIRLADWYWANLNNFHCHIQDQRVFWALQRDLTKLLYQHLHALFRVGRGAASESYAELSMNLSLKRLRAISEIRRQLKPAHDELLHLGFIGKWSLEPIPSQKKEYLVLWEAGPTWHEVYQKEREQLEEIERGPVREVLVQHDDTKSHELEISQEQEDRAYALKEIYDFVGYRDQAYEPFWKKVIDSFSRSIRHRVMAEVRELALSRRIRTTRARALVAAFQREGKKQNLSGWGGQAKKVLPDYSRRAP
jgi:hypothetical protein